MGDFKVINTQEELDTVIQDRLNRQKEIIEAKFSDYNQLKTDKQVLETKVGTLETEVNDFTTKSKTYDDTLAAKDTEISGYKTENLRTKIAIENGLPLDLVDRLTGTDEESIKEDAQKLSTFFKGNKSTAAPLKTTEPPLGDGNDEAYKGLLENLNLKGE